MENKNISTFSSGKKTLSLTDKKIISDLLTELKLIFPAWRNSIKNQKDMYEIQEYWARAFIAVGLTKTSFLKRGLIKAKQQDTHFFPTADQFIRWCMPVDPKRLWVWCDDKNLADYQRSKYLAEFGCYVEDDMVYFRDMTNLVCAQG